MSDEMCTLHEDCKQNVEISRACMRARLETPDGARLAKVRAMIKYNRDILVQRISETQQGSLNCSVGTVLAVFNQMLDV